MQPPSALAHKHEEFHEDHKKFYEQYDQLSSENQKKVDEILTELHQNLQSIGVKIPHHIQMDNETKRKLHEIKSQLKEGTITTEEAEKKMTELGIEPHFNHKKQLFEGLDDTSKEKAKDIIEQMKNDEISKEEGRKELEALGVNLPKCEELDDQTKEQAKAYIEEVKKKFEEIEIEFPDELYHHLVNS